MALKLITAPADNPVSLEEAKAHLQVDFDDDDALIGMLITAATASLDGPDGWLGRCLKPQTWDLIFDEFPDCSRGIRIPIPPLISIDSVHYVHPDTALEVVLPTDAYQVDDASFMGWIVPTDDWPATLETINAVRIRFVAGYADTEDSPPATTVPLPLRQAILLMVRDMYDQRGSYVVGAAVSQIPDAVDRLISPYCIVTL